MRKTAFPAIALILFSSCGSDGVNALFKKEYKTEPVSVNAVRTGLKDGVTSTRLVGKVEAGKSAVVSSPFPGTLAEVYVKEGQRVEKGATLARIDAQSVNSAYEIAKADFEQASDALERVDKVYGNGSVSEVRLKDIDTQYAKAKASLESAEKALENCCVKAPFGGVISEIMAEQGVELSVFAPVFRIMDNSTVEIHASIPENEYAAFKVGSEATIRIPAAARTVRATLVVKGIQASALSHSYDLCFKLDEVSDGIMPGMTCKVLMSSSSSSEGQIVIPASAVKTDACGKYVWCITDGTVEKRRVMTGGFSGDGVIVEDGLHEGDLVVTEGARKVSSGMKGIKVNIL